jgi:hypothetical protein
MTIPAPVAFGHLEDGAQFLIEPTTGGGLWRSHIRRNARLKKSMMQIGRKNYG